MHFRYSAVLLGLLTALSAVAEQLEPLAWERRAQNCVPKMGESTITFVFPFKNVSAEPVEILSATASCGCTIVKLPAQPWRIAPGASGEIKAAMNLRGKAGRISKPILIRTSVGDTTLTVIAQLPDAPAFPSVAPEGELSPERLANLALVQADRQAIFKGDCRTCHVDPGVNKTGGELYLASCSICHESSHRAAQVPDLRRPKGPRDEDYWTRWAAHSQPGSIMPAFAQSEGGPLTPAQIDSLAVYLRQNFPSGNPRVPGSGRSILRPLPAAEKPTAQNFP